MKKIQLEIRTYKKLKYEDAVLFYEQSADDLEDLKNKDNVAYLYTDGTMIYSAIVPKDFPPQNVDEWQENHYCDCHMILTIIRPRLAFIGPGTEKQIKYAQVILNKTYIYQLWTYMKNEFKPEFKNCNEAQNIETTQKIFDMIEWLYKQPASWVIENKYRFKKSGFYPLDEFWEDYNKEASLIGIRPLRTLYKKFRETYQVPKNLL